MSEKNTLEAQLHQYDDFNSSLKDYTEMVEFAENETDGTTKLTIFDTDGKKKNTIITGITYTGMCINDSELVVYNNSSCVMYNLDGSEKFRTQIEGGIKTLFPAGNNKYYIVGANEVKLITLKTDD